MATHISAPLDFSLERDKYLERLDGEFQERVLGTDIHSDCQLKVTALLKRLAKRLNAKVRLEWTLAHGDDWLIPDVMMTFPGRFATDARGYLSDMPFLCIEILSPGQTQSVSDIWPS